MNSFLYDNCKNCCNYKCCLVISINMKYLHARIMHDSDLKSCLWGPVPSVELAFCLRDILRRQVYSCPGLKDQGALLLATNVCMFSFTDISCYKNKLAKLFLGLLLCGSAIAFSKLILLSDTTSSFLLIVEIQKMNIHITILNANMKVIS